MKVIFVGMHNKPNKQPLDSSTMTGKVIDSIIEKIPVECVKTNLWDVDVFPKHEDKFGLTLTWIKRSSYENGDVIVLLGTEVKKWFSKVYELNCVFLAHPAGIFGPKNKDEYIRSAVEKIKNYCT